MRQPSKALTDKFIKRILIMMLLILTVTSASKEKLVGGPHIFSNKCKKVIGAYRI